MSHHDEEILGKAYDAVLMRRLLRYLWPYRLYVVVALVSIVCSSVLQLAQPYLMKLAIDRHIATADLAGLDRIALGFLAILLASFALEYLQTWVLQMTGQRIMFDMRMQIYGHLQRIDLQEEVAASVYESMKRTFEGIARMERGEGEKEKNIVMAEADRKRTELVARALPDAQRIRGEGEATAAAIYAQAYNRNPEFYSFYRSLQAYRNSLGREGDVLVISPDSDFFRYLQNPSPRR